MEIVVVTGASSGIGRELARLIDEAGQFDEMWVLGRSRERLESLRPVMKAPLRMIECDLSTPQGLTEYTDLLNHHSPTVKMLVNAAGYGKFGRYDEVPLPDAMGMIGLNCLGLVGMTVATLPYMREGGSILQMASLSSYQPLPYFSVYAASKALVLSYSRALNVELRGRSIHCMAVTPGWVRTDFFDRAFQSSKTAVTHFSTIHLPAAVAKKAMSDLRRGKDISVLGLGIRLQILAVKLLPHKLVMKVWMRQQRHRL